jgi:hypothetical protein
MGTNQPGFTALDFILRLVFVMLLGIKGRKLREKGKEARRPGVVAPASP